MQIELLKEEMYRRGVPAREEGFVLRPSALLTTTDYFLLPTDYRLLPTDY